MVSDKLEIMVDVVQAKQVTLKYCCEMYRDALCWTVAGTADVVTGNVRLYQGQQTSI